MEKKEKSKLKKILENRPVLSGIAMIAIAFTFGLVYATNSTYAYTTEDCPSGWAYLGSNCTKTFTTVDECKSAIAILGLEYDGENYYCSYHQGDSSWATGYLDIEKYLDETSTTTRKVTAYFEANGGTISDSEAECIINLEAGETECTIEESSVPTVEERTAYDFLGWGTSSSCDSLVTEFKLSKSTTYYACWVEKYSQDDCPSGWTYSSGSGKCTKTFSTNTECETALENLGLSDVGTCNRVIGSFNITDYIGDSGDDGNNDGGNSGDTGSSGDSSSSGSTTTTQTFTATYNGNGGTVNGQISDKCTTEAGKTYCNISNFPTASKSGVTFVGWSKTQSCDTVYKEWVSLYKNTTLYACYETDTSSSVKTYTITYNGNGGTVEGKTSDSCTTSGSSCTVTTLPIAKRDGYSFKGWGTSTSCTSGKSGSDEISLSGNATYYACWDTVENATPANYYTVKFNLDGGKFADGLTSRSEVVADNIIYYGPRINPVKEGYVFAGWYEGSTKYTFGGTISGNINATAKWIVDTDTRCEYTCDSGDVYDPSTGKCIETQEFGGKTYYTSTYTNQISCSGSLLWEETSSSCSGNCNGEYSCDTGFQSDAYRTENTCQLGSSCSPSGETKQCTDTWYARCFRTYEPEKECVPATYYTVKFDLNGGKFADGSTTREEVVANNVRYYGPRTNPVREGYVFDGWYNGNTKYEFWVVSKDVTLKAKWVKDTAKCEYECNSGDVYDPSLGQCVKTQKFDGGKNYYTSTFNNVVSCNSIGEWVETSSNCTGSCNTESCGDGFSSDAYRTVNTCQLNSACSVEGDSKDCQDTWIARCYQTYEAEEICDPENIEQVGTSDILIGIVWFIGLLGLGYGIYYFKELKNK